MFDLMHSAMDCDGRHPKLSAFLLPAEDSDLRIQLIHGFSHPFFRGNQPKRWLARLGHLQYFYRGATR